ncbi:unnamed protein product [Moneuplotes crassus]|uniref:CUE domain-containing protein n=1 Tax=Euplotes crassus TaxID=5936 RepID=A0AAD1UQ77_EUPCR|nr:unnamed protein product [Moneuplotes crassus]
MPKSLKGFRQAKRFKKAHCEVNEYVEISHKIPFTRLKLQFPDLNEESLQTLLEECDNDMMKAINSLNKGKSSSFNCNPFHKNQEHSSNFDPSGNFEVKRKRRFNEISVDSTFASQAPSQVGNIGQKIPFTENSKKIEQIIEDFSSGLLFKLKSSWDEENALSLIKNSLSNFADQINTSTSSSFHKAKSTEGKDFEEKRKIISDTIKKLMKDNVALKKGIRILCKMNEENDHKTSQFDNLAREYQRLKEENQKLERGLNFYKYANGGPQGCNDGVFSNSNNYGNNGGSGAY